MVPIRAVRLSAKASQVAFATRLGSHRKTTVCGMPVDAIRRRPCWRGPEHLPGKGLTISHGGLPELARVLGVSVYRFREAAKDGRLAVTYGNRVVFGHPVP
jgi:hypothetical protein